MADAELDELYRVQPEGFTALRGRLAAAAKERGDASAANRISAARKPTTAAWIVNQLALSSKEAVQRLRDLGARLRAAHAAMDGDRIRALSTEQRMLVNELARSAFEAVALTNPSAAQRDDVTATLQAAIADPEVSAQLGRLTKVERWSGFGEFGEATAKPPQAPRTPANEREKASAALAAAERAKAEADDVLSERHADLAAARLRHDEARRGLREAERQLNAAETAYDKAQQASRDAAELVREAKSRL
jgi:hypothetical protein